MDYSVTPYILLTVHRRYNILAANLRYIQQLKNEFEESPKIVVVRGDPERKVDKLFEQWEADGLINYTYDRPSIGEGFNITLLEELNIHQGVLNIKAERLKNHNYRPYYTIVQAGDCFAQQYTYRQIDKAFNIFDIEIITVNWQNHLNAKGVHTNFFAYNPQKTSGPITYENNNVLEVQFYQQLMATYNTAKINLFGGDLKWCNLNMRQNNKPIFYHTHTDVDGDLQADLKANLKINGEECGCFN